MPAFIFYGGLNPGSQIITATGAGSFVVPAFTARLRVRGWGGGGGGDGSNNAASSFTAGADGGVTTFSPPGGTLTANSGKGPTLQFSPFRWGLGGTASGGDTNITGEDGFFQDFQGTNIGRGGAAGGTAFGGGARAMVPQTSARKNGTAGNAYGGGGSGATGFTGSFYFTMAGGGGGGFFEKVYLVGELNAGSSIDYVIGAGGVGGNDTWDGGNGANGALVVDWDY